MQLLFMGKSRISQNIWLMRFLGHFITVTFSIFGYFMKIAVMKYFGPENALAKYIWKVLKSRSNEIRIRRGSPVNVLKL